MSYVKLSVLSDTLNKANANGRTRFATIDDVLKLQEKYEETDFSKMIEESKNQSIGKIATKEVTGLVGAPLAGVMSVAVMLKHYLSDEDIFNLHPIEQISVQFKNIAKRGLWEKDPLFYLANEEAKKYGIEDIVKTALDMVRGKADIGAILEEPIERKASTDLFLDDEDDNNGNSGNNGNKDFDFSNL